MTLPHRSESALTAAGGVGKRKLGAAALVLLCAVGGLALAVAPLGPLSHHMAIHLLLMNGVAPAIGLLYANSTFAAGDTNILRRSLFAACAAQIGALWLVHAPPAIAASMHEPAIHMLAQLALLAVALWFWLAVFAQHGAARWRAMFALLITGKLFCLLAALLVFSPRVLYPYALAAHRHAPAAADLLSDQHLAGLLMLVLCPLTYVLAGVLIAERWLRELRDDGCNAQARSATG
jgi:putative membrane protein